jgi:hypothetical protein
VHVLEGPARLLSPGLARGLLILVLASRCSGSEASQIWPTDHLFVEHILHRQRYGTGDSAPRSQSRGHIPVMDHRIMLASKSVFSTYQTQRTLHHSGTKPVLSREHLRLSVDSFVSQCYSNLTSANFDMGACDPSTVNASAIRPGRRFIMRNTPCPYSNKILSLENLYRPR